MAIMALMDAVMSDFTDTTHLPSTGQERTVCTLTLAGSLFFVFAAGYSLVSPVQNGWMLGVVEIAGIAFALTLLNFFIAAFRGKLCGRDKK